jgi:NADH-quinone oxidoreductase subunit K
MFFIGIFGFITRKNMIAILISLELVLNAVEINFAVFNRYLYPEQLEGMFFTLFGIAITAAETAVALAIIINAYRSIGNININNMNKMKL